MPSNSDIIFDCLFGVQVCKRAFKVPQLGARTAEVQTVQHSVAMVPYYRYLLTQASEFGSHNLQVSSERVFIVVRFYVSSYSCTLFDNACFVVLVRTVKFPNDILDRLKCDCKLYRK